jgi:hypothetical protein
MVKKMKKTIILFAVIVMMVNITTILTAQTSAKVTTNAGAVLIVPLSLTQTSPLHFGTINLITIAAGTCILSTTGVRTFTGGLGASTSIPVATNAAYTVTGKIAATYSVTLPAAAVTIAIGSSVAAPDMMTVTAFTARFTGAPADALTSKLSATGTDSFTVGATLTSMASQNAGVYTGTFNISVDYN